MIYCVVTEQPSGWPVTETAQAKGCNYNKWQDKNTTNKKWKENETTRCDTFN